MLCLQFHPRTVAAGCIYLACTFLKFNPPINLSPVYESARCQKKDVTEISNQIFDMYERNKRTRTPQPAKSPPGGTASCGGTTPNPRPPASSPSKDRHPSATASANHGKYSAPAYEGYPAGKLPSQPSHAARPMDSTSMTTRPLGGLPKTGSGGPWGHPVGKPNRAFRQSSAPVKPPALGAVGADLIGATIEIWDDLDEVWRRATVLKVCRTATAARAESNARFADLDWLDR
jgi:hypothetical protein